MMNCPICNIELKLSERSGVEIEYCSQCRGVWLDRGELDKIIEKNSSQQAYYGESNNRGHYEEPRNHHDYDTHGHNSYNQYGGNNQNYKHKHKKKSFLEDIFDFG